VNARTLPLLPLLALVILSGCVRPAAEKSVAAAKIRVACVGASITAGFGTTNHSTQSYPAQMQAILGPGYEVRNFGVSGTTMLRKGDRPYWAAKRYQQALASRPDIAVIDLGGNDSKATNWVHKDDFSADAADMVRSFQSLPSHPRVLLCLPMPSFRPPSSGINDQIISNELPILRKIAFDTGVEPVDMHTAFLGKGSWFADGIHPNAEGAALAAKTLAGIISFPADPSFNIEKNLARRHLDLTITSFYGYRQLDFTVPGGRQCTIVRPKITAAGRPFAWRGEFFGHEPQTDIALLQCGFHVAYVNAKNMYGAPAAMAIWEQLDDLLVKAGLTGKITLIGMSRGGLYCYNWAALHPQTVSVIYGDAPVCDFKSWPGCLGRSRGPTNDWLPMLKVYGFKNKAEALAYKKNPVDNLAPIAAAGIPIIHVVGQADTLVPVEENTDLVEQRYKALGGTIQVIRKPGADHHPHSLPNPQPIVDFILSHQR
jgi:lysophospholipase L1-like esterase